MSDPPWLTVPYRPQGCSEQVAAFILRWLARLALFGAGFIAGCAVEMVRCGK